MGLTIHYSGEFKSRQAAKEALDFLEEVAKINEWERWRQKKSKKITFEPAVPSDGKFHQVEHQVEEVGMNIDEGCESFVVYYEPSTLKMVQAFCKTQYSVDFLKTHMTICRLLHHLENNFLKSAEIYDEGHYYENKDIGDLQKNKQANAAMIEGIGASLKKAFGDDNIISGKDLKRGIGEEIDTKFPDV